MEDEVFIINPPPAGSVNTRFPLPGMEHYHYPLSAGEIKEMKIILNRGSLEVILKPIKPKEPKKQK